LSINKIKIFSFLAACLFPLYFVGNSVGFGHGRLVRSLAFVVSASSKGKNTSPYRFTLKFEVKFTNFTRRDPYPENAKFKLATLCVSKAMSPP